MLEKKSRDYLVILSAYRWWLARRPFRWTELQHLENPRINTINPTEVDLADAVARWVALNLRGKGKKGDKIGGKA
jgi:hypothetical protein